MIIAAIGFKSTEIFVAAEDAAAEEIIDENAQLDDQYSNEFTGEYICLPHTDTSGPQTLECALGMKLDDGTYVALDTQNLAPEESQGLTNGNIYTVYGNLVPIEELSTDHWQKYPITGIVQVSEVKL